LTTTTTPSSAAGSRASARRAVLLVFCCTLLGAGAQVLIKNGANALPHPSVLQMITSVWLLSGYCLYGLSTVLLVVALKHGQLSLLYPVISLTYVWVTILSVIVFHEVLNPYKIAGIVLIVAGVGVLGLNGRKP
jgi:drug/metabolite transporter (DMT)-like permease